MGELHLAGMFLGIRDQFLGGLVGGIGIGHQYDGQIGELADGIQIGRGMGEFSREEGLGRSRDPF